MTTKHTSHIIPILQALLVTFLWSTSFILIKWGLSDIPPVTYAGLRYSIAALCFVPLLLKPQYLNELRSLTGRQRRTLLALGVIFYAFTQGAQFLGLSLLPAVTVSLWLNFTPLVVAVMGIFLLSEKPTPIQWSGALTFIVGIFIYFMPVDLGEGQALGLVVMTFGVLANSGAAVMGRAVNRNRSLSSFIITFVSMSFGAVLLLAAGLSFEEMPVITGENFFYLLWLAVINTAFAFTLWNRTLRSLSAMESSIINGTMLIQIAVLAWIFLGESITLKEGLGMSVAALGAFLVQRRGTNKDKNNNLPRQNKKIDF